MGAFDTRAGLVGGKNIPRLEDVAPTAAVLAEGAAAGMDAGRQVVFWTGAGAGLGAP